MQKNRLVLFIIGFMILFGFPSNVFASTKQLDCTYSYNRDVSGLNKISFVYTVYDDKVEFGGFKGCKIASDDNCFLNNDNAIFLSNNLKKQILQEAYNSKSKNYECPSLAYHQNGNNFNVVIAGNMDENTFPLKVSEKAFSENTNAHKKICSGTYTVKGIGAKNDQLKLTIYYESPSVYSVTYNRGYGDEKGPKAAEDIQLSLNNRQISIDASTLKKLYGDFDPKKGYTSAECNQKKLYINDYTSYLKGETKKGGTTSSTNQNTTKPTNPNNNKKPVNSTNSNVGDCKSILGPTLTKELKSILTMIQVAGVILAIILGAGDFINSIISGKSDENGKAGKRFITRAILAGVLIIVPTLLKWIITTFGLTEYSNSFCII